MTGFPQRRISTMYVPTVDDVAYARQLAEKLRGRDDADTLNNVLEWVEKNISKWRERALFGYESRSRLLTLYLCVYLALIIAPPIALFLFLSLSSIQRYLSESLSWHHSLVSAVVLASVLIYIIEILRGIYLKLARALFFALTMWTLLIILSKTGVLSQNPTSILMLLQRVFEPMGWFVVGASLLMLLHFSTIYSVFYVRDGGKNRLAKALALMDLTFQPSIPLREILRYRLAVCRDYAKLLASVLVNLYPGRNIYFLVIPGHVATAIEFEGKLYVLDQRLPIMSLNAWMRRWGVKRAEKRLLVRSEDGFSVKDVGEVAVEEDSLGLNLRKDLEELADAVYGAIKSGQRPARYIFRGYGRVFDVDDPVIKESLKRAVRTALEKELVAYRHLIRELKLLKQGEDVEVIVDFEEGYSGAV
ncbi:MAG: transglutaminase-like domain-containing protein [Desulfurococcaceae archaeon]